MKTWCVYERDSPMHVIASCKTVSRDIFVREPQRPTRIGRGYCIASVVTASEYRGLGIAALLLNTIADWLDEDAGADASLLYSSAGNYYVNKGWDLLPSMQSILLTDFPSESAKSNLPSTRLVMADKITDLSRRDVERLKTSLDSSDVQGSSILTSPIPSPDVISIQHAREDFFGSKLRPDLSGTHARGCICESADAWIYWYRDYRDDQLAIQRTSLPDEEEQSLKATARLLLSAAVEAKRCGLGKVVVWNPSEIIIRALQLLSDETGAHFRIEPRNYNMPSIRWRRAERTKAITVQPNEFYAWG